MKNIQNDCECKEYCFKNDKLVCKKCGKQMEKKKKPLTIKGRRILEKNGMLP